MAMAVNEAEMASCIMRLIQTYAPLRLSKYLQFREAWSVSANPHPVCSDMSSSMVMKGFAIRRTGWNGKGLFVIKQVPAHIESDIIPRMQSLPQSAKDLILKGKGFIDYTSQCLIYNENTGRADSWVPSISDVFAEDWEIVQ